MGNGSDESNLSSLPPAAHPLPPVDNTVDMIFRQLERQRRDLGLSQAQQRGSEADLHNCKVLFCSEGRGGSKSNSVFP